MKAVIVKEYGLDKPMTVEEIDDPKPGPGEVVVRTRACGINPSDAALRTGMPQKAYKAMMAKKAKGTGQNSAASKLQGAFLAEPPYVPGGEAAGDVVAVGEDVDDVKKGDRIFGRTLGGGYAELVRMTAKGALPLPEDLSYAQGAGIVVNFYSAWNALVLKAQVGAGERVLIQGGAGGVGSAAIQLAKSMGCVVYATVSSKEKANFCASLGADETINYKDEDVVQRCMQLTGGRGVDAIVEMAATDNLDTDLAAISVNGRIAVVGNGTGKGPTTEIRIPVMMTKDARIFGQAGANFYHMAGEVTRRFLPLLQSGALKVHIDTEYSFSEANEAHKALLSGKFLGKLVLAPD